MSYTEDEIIDLAETLEEIGFDTREAKYMLFQPDTFEGSPDTFCSLAMSHFNSQKMEERGLRSRRSIMVIIGSNKRPSGVIEVSGPWATAYKAIQEIGEAMGCDKVFEVD